MMRDVRLLLAAILALLACPGIGHAQMMMEYGLAAGVAGGVAGSVAPAAPPPAAPAAAQSRPAFRRRAAPAAATPSTATPGAGQGSEPSQLAAEAAEILAPKLDRSAMEALLQEARERAAARAAAEEAALAEAQAAAGPAGPDSAEGAAPAPTPPALTPQQLAAQKAQLTRRVLEADKLARAEEDARAAEVEQRLRLLRGSDERVLNPIVAAVLLGDTELAAQVAAVLDREPGAITELTADGQRYVDASDELLGILNRAGTNAERLTETLKAVFTAAAQAPAQGEGEGEGEAEAGGESAAFAGSAAAGNTESALMALQGDQILAVAGARYLFIDARSGQATANAIEERVEILDLIAILRGRDHDVYLVTPQLLLISQQYGRLPSVLFSEPGLRNTGRLQRRLLERRDQLASGETDLEFGDTAETLFSAALAPRIRSLIGPEEDTGAEAGDALDQILGEAEAAAAAAAPTPEAAEAAGGAGEAPPEAAEEAPGQVSFDDPNDPAALLDVVTTQVPDPPSTAPLRESGDEDAILSWLFTQLQILTAAEQGDGFVLGAMMRRYAQAVLDRDPGLEPVVQVLLAPLESDPALQADRFRVAHVLVNTLRRGLRGERPLSAEQGRLLATALAGFGARASVGIAGDALLDRVNTLALLADQPRIGIADDPNSNGAAFLGPGAHLIGNPEFGQWTVREAPEDEALLQLQALQSTLEEVQNLQTGLSQGQGQGQGEAGEPQQVEVTPGPGEGEGESEQAEGERQGEEEEEEQPRFLIWVWAEPFASFPDRFPQDIDFVHWYHQRPFSFHMDYGRFLYPRTREDRVMETALILTGDRLERLARALGVTVEARRGRWPDPRLRLSPQTVQMLNHRPRLVAEIERFTAAGARIADRLRQRRSLAASLDQPGSILASVPETEDGLISENLLPQSEALLPQIEAPRPPEPAPGAAGERIEVSLITADAGAAAAPAGEEQEVVDVVVEEEAQEEEEQASTRRSRRSLGGTLLRAASRRGRRRR